MRRFFGCESDGSSFSLSLASLFTPATTDTAVAGVSGGVVSGSPVTLAEFVAAMLGTAPLMSVGPDCVATEEAELLRVGDGGRAPPVAGGEGAVKDVAELRC